MLLELVQRALVALGLAADGTVAVVLDEPGDAELVCLTLRP